MQPHGTCHRQQSPCLPSSMPHAHARPRFAPAGPAQPPCPPKRNEAQQNAGIIGITQASMRRGNRQYRQEIQCQPGRPARSSFHASAQAGVALGSREMQQKTDKQSARCAHSRPDRPPTQVFPEAPRRSPPKRPDAADAREYHIISAYAFSSPAPRSARTAPHARSPTVRR